MITENDLRFFLNQKLTEIGTILLAHYDPCAIRGSACKAGDPNPCCVNSQYARGLCPFWLHGGCTFDNCDCRLWLCQTAIQTTDPRCIEALKLLEQLGKLYGLVRAPLIGDPYTGADKQPGGSK